MRVVLGKLQCPFICFCKPSSQIYTSRPLRLENTPQTTEQTQTQTQTQTKSQTEINESCMYEDDATEVNESEDGIGITNHNQNPGCLESCLTKASSQKSEPATCAQKKKVQWLDFLGKELAQIREFESR